MSDLFKRIDLSKLYPPFRAKIEQLAANCRAQGVDYWAICGLRSVEEQNALYAQGRTKPGPIVTKARGGQSYHGFGLAVDFCRDADTKREGLQPTWDMPGLKVLADEAKKLGLEAGYYWKFIDGPHVQWPLYKHAIKLDKLLAIYNKGGLEAVWKELDTYSW
jgi:peptidoglycan L-alanyl-D-glutamate endopeptidase CwlK